MVNGAGSVTTSSGGRLPAQHVNDLAGEALALYSHLSEMLSRTPASVSEIYVNSDGTLGGPFNAMLLNPRVGEAMQSLGSAIQAGTVLSAQARELAILTVAHELDSKFIEHAHRAIGAVVGLDEDDVAWATGSLTSRPPEALKLAVVTVTRALIRDRDLDDEAFQHAEMILGRRGLFDLSCLVGYYALLALQLRLFRVSASP